MVNKKSPYYVKSEFEKKFSGNENSTTFERELKVKGKDRDHVKYAAIHTQSEVM